MRTTTPKQHDPAGEGPPSRLFIYEPGWSASLKVGSEREFCYATAPGQDFYHRLLDGEIYLKNAEEKLCLACAERRGLLARQPKGLREQVASFEFDAALPVDPIDLGTPPGEAET